MVKGKEIETILSTLLRELRLAKYLSQKKVAELCGFERSYISKIEMEIERFSVQHSLDLQMH